MFKELPIETRLKIDNLRNNYQAEMMAQNNNSLLVRSYRRADEILSEIKELEQQH